MIILPEPINRDSQKCTLRKFTENGLEWTIVCKILPTIVLGETLE